MPCVKVRANERLWCERAFLIDARTYIGLMRSQIRIIKHEAVPKSGRSGFQAATGSFFTGTMSQAAGCGRNRLTAKWPWSGQERLRAPRATGANDQTQA